MFLQDRFWNRVKTIKTIHNMQLNMLFSSQRFNLKLNYFIFSLSKPMKLKENLIHEKMKILKI